MTFFLTFQPPPGQLGKHPERSELGVNETGSIERVVNYEKFYRFWRDAEKNVRVNPSLMLGFIVRVCVCVCACACV